MAAVTGTGTGAFTSADHRRRIERLGTAATAAGLSGVLVTPGPDLVWLIGYRPQVDFAVVGSEPNGANPHHGAGPRVIGAGDVVVLDFGGLRDGYGSGTTRTVCVGEPSEDAVEVHKIVREAQQAAVAAVRPGVPCGEIDEVARAVITSAGFGDLFVHRTGHGVGVTTHESPYLVRRERQALVPGMCFAIEPGIYLPGEFGVRIEDVVAVTGDGGRRFNTTSRELAIVG